MAWRWAESALRFWTQNKRIVLAFLAGGATAGLIAGIGALAIVEFGLYNTAASQPHNKFVSWALHKTFERSVARRAEAGVAPEFTQARIVAGFKRYQTDCMTCHGGPGVARAEWVKGLEPTPPFLLNSGEQWSSQQLHSILAHGVKMSAMPSWGETRSNEQIWDLVAFLKALPRMSPAQFAEMQRKFPSQKSPPAP